MIALIVIFAIILLIAVLISIPLYFELQYIYNEKNSTAQVYLKYLCFKIALLPPKKKDKKKDKKKQKAEKPAEKKKFSFDDFKKYVDNVFLLWDDICEVIYILFKKSIYAESVKIHVDFGFDDPMITGMATGTLNALVYNLLSVIARCSNLTHHDVQLRPDFDNSCFVADVHCIIKIKIVHIIVIAIKVLKMFFKIK